MLVVCCVGVERRRTQSGRRRRQQQFLTGIAPTGHHFCVEFFRRIDRTCETGANIAQRIAALARVAHLLIVNRQRIEIFDVTRQCDLADLRRHHTVREGDNVVTCTHIDALGVTGDDGIVPAAEGYAVNTVPKINQKITGACSRCVIVAVRPAVHGDLGRRPVRVKPLSINAIRTTVLTIRTPRNDETAVFKGCDRLRILVTVRIGISPELGTHLGAVRFIDLTEGISTVAAFRVVIPVIIGPRDDKVPVLQRCNLWPVLGPAIRTNVT